MSLRQRYVKILSGMFPAGAAGVSLLLGSTPPSAAKEHPAVSQPSASDEDRVSERLAAIREAVSDVTESSGATAKSNDRNRQLAWGNWWGGWGRPWGGWGWPNWNNWRNWNNWPNFWRNW